MYVQMGERHALMKFMPYTRGPLSLREHAEYLDKFRYGAKVSFEPGDYVQAVIKVPRWMPPLRESSPASSEDKEEQHRRGTAIRRARQYYRKCISQRITRGGIQDALPLLILAGSPQIVSGTALPAMGSAAGAVREAGPDAHEQCFKWFITKKTPLD